MSYKKLLTDRCDIYHLQAEDTENPTFGVPVEDMQRNHYFPDAPDHKDVHSYFVENNQTVVQAEPNQVITEVYDVHFLKSTDIRLGDKVVWGGIVYKARKPRLIKNHHIEVVVYRSENI
ncbi:DUF3599 family protein [Lentibacillus sp. N15]|uniref:DUF3599 family protein n=1 Tax=Lentibacillus songyuanensis TaxID=3136161 RepID=UPI0031BBB1F1